MFVARDMAIDDSSETQLVDVLLESESCSRGRDAIRMTSHVRSVGFISKPGRIRELKTCLEGPLMDLLHQVPGFTSALVLHAQKESRNLLVLTFWESESQAADNSWEEFPAVRQLLSPLIDVFMKVRTFEATLSQPTERRRYGKTAAVC